MGREYGKSLALEREVEARQALASMGITSAGFFDAPNTASVNVIQTLERWDHASFLASVVRIIRLTRPEVLVRSEHGGDFAI